MRTDSEKEIQEAIEGHDRRNVSLKQLLLDKKVDIRETRPIDLHFWAASSSDAQGLADVLRTQGFTILVQRRAVVEDTTLPWNIEAQIAQSIDLTVRHEFTEELVRLAITHNARYDGWGTQI